MSKNQYSCCKPTFTSKGRFHKKAINCCSRSKHKFALFKTVTQTCINLIMNRKKLEIQGANNNITQTGINQTRNIKRRSLTL